MINIIKEFEIGSQSFFKEKMNYFNKLSDILYIVDKGDGYNFISSTDYSGRTEVYLVKRNKNELIDWVLNNSLEANLEIGKFLVKEVIDYLDITIDDLKLFDSIFSNLSDKFEYEKIIYDSYIENNSFDLTEEQLNKAYESYKESRQNDNKYFDRK
jgi:hypothetical protein